MPPKKQKKNRMEPLGQVSRELWMLSGNECAFPKCGERLVGEDGAFIGEVAHIVGAEAGSARHDPGLTRDELRAAENLMLLCANCHTRIDHVDSRHRYSVTALQGMKQTHEDRFRRAAAAFEADFRDYTRDAVVTYCTTLDQFAMTLSSPGAPPRTDEERAVDVPLVNGFADRMSRLTDSARNLLAFLIAEPGLLGLVEVSRRTKTGQYTIRRIVEELERENYAYIDPEPEEGEPREPIRLTSPGYFDGWPFFEDLRAYATDHETIRRIIVDLDFSVLD